MAADLAALGLSQPAMHPDADLFALCDQITALERRWLEIDKRVDNTLPKAELDAADDSQYALREASKPLIDRLNDLPTHTLAGFRARAKVIVTQDYGMIESDDNCDGMLWSLISGLAGGSV